MKTAPSRSLVRLAPSRRAMRRVARPALKSPPHGPRHGAIRGGNGERYKAGDPVPQSGIYEVIHARNHRESHDVVMLAGDHFPACDNCDVAVRFRLVRTAPYIFQDDDFEQQ